MGEMGGEGNKTQTFEDLSGYIDKSVSCPPRGAGQAPKVEV